MIVTKTQLRAAHFLTLPEAAKLCRRPVADVRIEISSRRLYLFPAVRSAWNGRPLNTSEAAWYLCLSRWEIAAMIRRGELAGEKERRGDFEVWLIPAGDVLRFAREREHTHRDSRSSAEGRR